MRRPSGDQLCGERSTPLCSARTRRRVPSGLTRSSEAWSAIACRIHDPLPRWGPHRVRAARKYTMTTVETDSNDRTRIEVLDGYLCLVRRPRQGRADVESPSQSPASRPVGKNDKELLPRSRLGSLPGESHEVRRWGPRGGREVCGRERCDWGHSRRLWVEQCDGDRVIGNLTVPQEQDRTAATGPVGPQRTAVQRFRRCDGRGSGVSPFGRSGLA